MAEVVKTVYIIIFSSVGVSFPRLHVSGTMTHLKLGWKLGHDFTPANHASMLIEACRNTDSCAQKTEAGNTLVA